MAGASAFLATRGGATFLHATEKGNSQQASDASGLMLSLNAVASAVTQYGTATNYNNISHHHHYPEQVQSFVDLPAPFSQESILGLIPVKNPNFSGRIKALATIEASLQHACHGIITQNVVGLGGIGKTQLVAEYVHQAFAKKQYSFIAWLDGTHPKEAYQDLGRKLGLQFNPTDSEKQCIESIERQLSRHYTSLLLVWDDAKNKAQMEPYLSSAMRLKAHCLVTSRAQDWGGMREHFTMIRLDVFDEDEALVYIEKRCLPYPGLFEKEAGKALARTLHYLPLALSQALAYIVEKREQGGRCNYSFNQYLTDYKQAPANTLKKMYTTSSSLPEDCYQETVWTTWYLSISALGVDSDPVKLIEMCAYLDGNAIAEQFLCTLTNHAEDALLDNIQALLNYSLVERVRGGHFLSIKMHQLLQKVIRLHLQQETLHNIPLNSPVLSDSEMNRSQDIPETLIIRRYLTNVDTQWQWRQRQELLTFVKTKPLAHTISRQELVAAEVQDKHTSWQLSKLTISSQNATRHHHMLALLLRRLEQIFIYDKNAMGQAQNVYTLFANHVNIICSHALNNQIGEPDAIEQLAKLGDLAGLFMESTIEKEVCLKVLRYKEQHYGSDSIFISGPLNNLGIVYSHLGSLQETEERLRRSLSILEKHYGAEHICLEDTLNNLAIVVGDLRNLQEKKKLLEKAQNLVRTHYGPQFVKLDLLVNLAHTYGALGDPQRQKNLLERALILEETRTNPSPVAIGNILVNLSSAYATLNNPEKQKQLLERALDLEEKYYGPQHVNLAITLNNLAIANAALNNHQETKQQFERALSLQERHFGLHHFEVAATLSNLAIMYFNQGTREAWVTGLSHLEKAHQIFIHHPNRGPQHPETQKTETLLKKQKAVFELGEREEELYKKKAVQVHQKGVDHYNAGHWAEAMTYFLEGLKQNKFFYENQLHEDLAISHWCISSCYLKQNNYKAALPHMQAAYDIRVALLGETHPLTQKTKKRLETWSIPETSVTLSS